jgi:hypothetical protein
MSEQAHQAALITWWSHAHRRFGLPEYALLAVPNGGRRDALTGAMLKSSGVRRGVPDLLLPVAKGQYRMLWVEMKWGKNKLTKEQAEFMSWQEAEGAKVAVCYSWTEARTIIEEYLS